MARRCYPASPGQRAPPAAGARGAFRAATGSSVVIRFPTGERSFALGAAPHRDPDARWRRTLDGAVLTRVR